MVFYVRFGILQSFVSYKLGSVKGRRKTCVNNSFADNGLGFWRKIFLQPIVPNSHSHRHFGNVQKVGRVVQQTVQNKNKPSTIVIQTII